MAILGSLNVLLTLLIFWTISSLISKTLHHSPYFRNHILPDFIIVNCFDPFKVSIPSIKSFNQYCLSFQLNLVPVIFPVIPVFSHSITTNLLRIWHEFSLLHCHAITSLFMCHFAFFVTSLSPFGKSGTLVKFASPPFTCTRLSLAGGIHHLHQLVSLKMHDYQPQKGHGSAW